jgi:small-conductance mechanosensitive channel
MLDTIQRALYGLSDSLAWIPKGLVAVIILLLAALIALGVHAAVVAMLRRALARRPYLRSLLRGTARLTQIALLLVALFIALPAAPFSDDVSAVLQRILAVALIVLFGWIAIAITHISADLYLMRFKQDVADNLLARKHLTQVRVLLRVVDALLVMVTIGAALMTFEAVRQYGVSLFASAGVAGLIAGFAARPVLTNLIAGIQLAVTQPIRIEDAIVVEGESGRVEEITSTYVVVRLWDMRRMVVPLSYFIEKPFQNWTRESGSLTGVVLLEVDYTTPVERVRTKAIEIVKASPLWDGKLAKLQVTDASAVSMQLRVLASARSSADAFDLRCEVREKLIDFLQREFPSSLPRQRQENLAAHTAPARNSSSPHP